MYIWSVKKILFTFLLVVPLLISAQQKTYVPDDAFETALWSIGLDDGILGNDSVWTSAIDTLTSWTYGGILDATGIEDFTALEYVAFLTQLTHLDLSHNLNLKRVSIQNGALEILNINNCILLERLVINENNLTSLDLSDNINLNFLYCYDNPLICLDVSNNTKLEWIGAGEWDSPITTIDISNNDKLVRFYCPESPNLRSVNAQNGNNTNFDVFSVMNNPLLECVLVDDSVYSNNTSGWFIDANTYFSNNCTVFTIVEPPKEDKTIIKIFDILGRETNPVPNVLLFYLYKDGTVEKKLIIE